MRGRSGNPYIWRDLNGDGAFETNEFVIPVTSCFHIGHLYGFQVAGGRTASNKCGVDGSGIHSENLKEWSFLRTSFARPSHDASKATAVHHLYGAIAFLRRSVALKVWRGGF